MKDPAAFKISLHQHCLELVQQQLDTIQSSLDQLMEAKANETKSSAGDKYETGMAMIQNQEDLYKRQQIEAQNKWNVLKSIDPTQTYSKVENGALIELSTGWFYIATALQEIQLKGESVFVISNNSPLIKEAIGMKTAGVFHFRNQQIAIKNVY